jgi:hypothetical protein
MTLPLASGSVSAARRASRTHARRAARTTTALRALELELETSPGLVDLTVDGSRPEPMTAARSAATDRRARRGGA